MGLLLPPVDLLLVLPLFHCFEVNGGVPQVPRINDLMRTQNRPTAGAIHFGTPDLERELNRDASVNAIPGVCEGMRSSR